MKYVYLCGCLCVWVCVSGSWVWSSSQPGVFSECITLKSCSAQLVQTCPCCAEELVAVLTIHVRASWTLLLLLLNKRSKVLSELWINDSICVLKCSCQCDERRWKKDKLHLFFGISWDCLLESCESCKNSLISNVVSNNIDKPEFLFNAFDSLVNHQIRNPIVSTSVMISQLLCWQNLCSSISTISRCCWTQAVFDQFEPIFTVLTVRCSLWNAANGQPLWHLLIQLNLLFFWSTIHACFGSGRFPAPFKHAIMRPLLEMPNLDPSVLSNFRPNCPSYWRKLFYTVAVIADILVTLNLTTASDTVDQDTILAHLDHCVGSNGSVLKAL